AGPGDGVAIVEIVIVEVTRAEPGMTERELIEPVVRRVARVDARKVHELHFVDVNDDLPGCGMYRRLDLEVIPDVGNPDIVRAREDERAGRDKFTAAEMSRREDLDAA